MSIEKPGQPSAEKIREAKNTMEEFGLEERDKEEQIKNWFGLEYEKYLELSSGLKKLLENGYIKIDVNGIKVTNINNNSEVTEEALLECIEKDIGRWQSVGFDKITLDVDGANKPIVTLKVSKELFKKFPRARIIKIHYETSVEDGDITKLTRGLDNEGIKFNTEPHREDYGWTIYGTKEINEERPNENISIMD